LDIALMFNDGVSFVDSGP